MRPVPPVPGAHLAWTDKSTGEGPWTSGAVVACAIKMSSMLLRPVRPQPLRGRHETAGSDDDFVKLAEWQRAGRMTCLCTPRATAARPTSAMCIVETTTILLRTGLPAGTRTAHGSCHWAGRSPRLPSMRTCTRPLGCTIAPILPKSEGADIAAARWKLQSPQGRSRVTTERDARANSSWLGIFSGPAALRRTAARGGGPSWPKGASGSAFPARALRNVAAFHPQAR